MLHRSLAEIFQLVVNVIVPDAVKLNVSSFPTLVL